MQKHPRLMTIIAKLRLALTIIRTDKHTVRIGEASERASERRARRVIGRRRKCFLSIAGQKYVISTRRATVIIQPRICNYPCGYCTPQPPPPGQTISLTFRSLLPAPQPASFPGSRKIWDRAERQRRVMASSRYCTVGCLI